VSSSEATGLAFKISYWAFLGFTTAPLAVHFQDYCQIVSAALKVSGPGTLLYFPMTACACLNIENKRKINIEMETAGQGRFHIDGKKCIAGKYRSGAVGWR
jgi:hypothetical protein